MSHYETLGVPPDATADDVKRAYRASSSKAHPDKGGSNEDMAKVNRAYEVLSDPARRANYDAGTGEPGDSLEDQARAMLAELIDSVVDSHEPDIVSACHRRLNDARGEAEAMRRRAQNELKKLAARRKSVTKNGSGPNLMHAVIDKKIAQADATITKAGAVQALLEAAREQLKEYEHVPGQEPASSARYAGDATFDEIMGLMAANKRSQARNFRGFQP